MNIHPTSKRAASAHEQALPSSEAKRVILLCDLEASPIMGLLKTIFGEHVKVAECSTVDGLLGRVSQEPAGCLLLGDKLSDGTTAFGVLGEMAGRKCHLPTVMISSDASVQRVVESMRMGAVGYVEKPINQRQMRNEICHAFGICGSKTEQQRDPNTEAVRRVRSLNYRERQVVRMVSKGMLNKEISDALNLALVTVKVYRGRAMKKLGAGNPIELFRIAILGGFEFDSPLPRNQV